MPSRQDPLPRFEGVRPHAAGPTSRRSCPRIQAQKRRTVPHRVRHPAGGNALRCGCGFPRMLPTALRRCRLAWERSCVRWEDDCVEPVCGERLTNRGELRRVQRTLTSTRNRRLRPLATGSDGCHRLLDGRLQEPPL